MIRVVPAIEPAHFDERVRQPGLALIAQLAESAGSKDAIPPSQFKPYWRRALDDLMASYNRTCAYLSLYIPRVAGTPSVDHMAAKSKAWDRVYEWSNYRLACLSMNAAKALPTSWIHSRSARDGLRWNWLRSKLCRATACPPMCMTKWLRPLRLCV